METLIIGPKVVAVDDNPEHLALLASGFDSLGGLCLTLDYASAAVRAQPFPSGIRLVFMDINLLPGAGADLGARNFSPVLQVLRRVVGPSNGPYALVTWTDSPDSHEALMRFLRKNLAPSAQPCAEFCLSKGEYLGDPPGLASRLASLQAELPGLAMLLDWEKTVYEAADRAVFGIMGLSAVHGIAAGEAVVRAVQAIAEAASGAGAAEEPFRAFTSGMSSVLVDRMEHAAPAPALEAEWAAGLERFPRQDLTPIQVAALNSFLHFAAGPTGSQALGVVYELRVRDIIEFLKPAYKSGQQALLSGEFVPLKGQIQDPKTPQEIASGRTLARSCSWRFIQLGASCDHANRKARVAEGHLAVQVPATVFEHTQLVSSGQFHDNPARRDWLFQTPPFLIGEIPHVLVVNLRFRLSFPLEQASQLKPRYRCRESLAAEVADYSARYATRPGLVEFRKQLRA